MKRVLALVAHPDDEVLGCGGTLSRLARTGHEVRVVLPFRRCDPRGIATWDQLRTGFTLACAILGAEAHILDPLLDETDAEGQPHRVHDAILPHVEWADTVLTHWPGDVNQVHRGLARGVEIATRPFRRRKAVYLFEVATSTGQGFGPAFAPTMHVVLDAEDADRKCRAIEQYPTEAVLGRRPTDLWRRMEERGAEIGAELAEAYVVARQFLELPSP